MQLTQLSFQVQWHAWRGQESKFSPIFRPTNQPFSAERATLWLFNAFGLLNLPPIFQFSNCECVSVSLRQLEAKLKLQLFHCTMLTMLLLCVCPKNKAKKVEKDRGPNKKKGNQAKGCLIKLAQVRFVKMPKICLRKFPTSGTNKSRCCSICSTSSCRVCLARFACKTCVKLKHRLVKRRFSLLQQKVFLWLSFRPSVDVPTSSSLATLVKSCRPALPLFPWPRNAWLVKFNSNAIWFPSVFSASDSWILIPIAIAIATLL